MNSAVRLAMPGVTSVRQKNECPFLLESPRTSSKPLALLTERHTSKKRERSFVFGARENMEGLRDGLDGFDDRATQFTRSLPKLPFLAS